MDKYLYSPRYRPAGDCRWPDDLKRAWVYVEAPRDIAHLRRDIPVSRRLFGVVSVSRRLTDEECKTAEVTMV